METSPSTIFIVYMVYIIYIWSFSLVKQKSTICPTALSFQETEMRTDVVFRAYFHSFLCLTLSTVDIRSKRNITNIFLCHFFPAHTGKKNTTKNPLNNQTKNRTKTKTCTETSKKPQTVINFHAQLSLLEHGDTHSLCSLAVVFFLYDIESSR